MFARIAAGVRAARRHWTLAWWTGIALGLGAAVPALAETRAPADNEVLGYAAADRSGASTSWTLAADAPYLFVPFIGTEGAESVAAVEAGAGVGAVLFQRPYFATHDAGCAPDLGSDARPDLKWRGATARFSPPVEAPAALGAGEVAEPAAARISSLIVYRKDLGPPPGALLLDRRLTLGQSCLQGVHKIFFDRLFVPIATPPEPARCYNLAGTYPREGGKDFKVDFTTADRLVLLQPADLDDGYRGLRHRFRVTLFDGDGCRGGGGEFRSAGQEAGDIKLDQVGLRDRARSIKIVYEGGPLAPYYVAPTATPVASTAPAEEPPAAQATATPEPAAPAKLATAAPAASVAIPAAPDKLAAPAPAPAADDIVAAPAPAPVEKPVAQARPALIPLQAALPAPLLQLPEAKPAEPKLAPSNATFEYPVFEIYRLNYCLRWGADCGEPAATAWCKDQGFAKASAWQVDENIGALFPTIVLADKRVCAQFPCDGFEEITCSK